MAAYSYKTTPMEHQREGLRRGATKAGFAWFYDPGCVDSQTECLTATGWVPISEWSGQPIATWDSETKEAHFEHPSDYIALPYDGPMLEISGRNIPTQLVCPAHNVPVVNRKTGEVVTRRPQELLESPKIGGLGYWRMPNRFSMEGGSGINMSDEDIRLQIAVMADGHFPANCKSSRAVIRIKRQRKIERLMPMMASHPEAYIRTGSGYHVFSFTAPLKTKQWPVEWWQATTAQRKIILEELVHWDGSAAKNGRGWYFFSKHKSDIDLVQFLAACEGYITNIYFASSVWGISTRGTLLSGYHADGSNLKWVGPPVDGHRYCFTTRTGFWIARRDGCVYPTGNCGKTKIAIDNFCWALQAKHVDALLVVAPNSVQRQWAEDEIPKHSPEDIKCFVWNSAKAGSQRAKKAREELLKHDGPVCLCISYEASITKAARAFVERFMTRRKVFLVLDESHRIKGMKSLAKMWLTALGRRAVYRRALTGTPLEKPEDIYTQIRFLDNDFWARHGMRTTTEYRNRYCVFKGRNVPDRRPNARPGNRMIVQQVVDSKNLDELARYVSELSHRLTLESAGVVLPPQCYQKYYCELTPEQHRVYRELENSARTLLVSGDELKAESIMVRMLRLQQIICGYVACEAEQPIQRINKDGKNPRLELCVDEILSGITHQAIVWSRFREDISQLCDALGSRAVRFDGTLSDDEKSANKKRFLAGGAQFFVGNQDSGGTGLTLNCAKTMVFYSNNFKLITRLQAERRNYRIGQDESVRVVDIVAAGTIDTKIVTALQKKLDIASAVLQDGPKEWLT